MKTVVLWCGLVLVILLSWMVGETLWLWLGDLVVFLLFPLLFLLFWLVRKVLR